MSDTRTMTLTEFLLARIAETEATLLVCCDPTEIMGGRLVDAHALIRADAAAKRRIVDALAKCEWIKAQGHQTGYSQGELEAFQSAAAALALPYADHPDFREEWRP